MFGPADDVVCASSTTCFSAQDDSVSRYGGSTWSEPRSLPVDLGSGYGVTGDCPTSSFCMLVGAYGRPTSWNGTRWASRGSVPGYAGGEIGVDCVSATFCMTLSDKGAAVFNGSSWRTVSLSALPNGGNGLGCVSATECYTVSGNDLWRWTGSGWQPDVTGITGS